MKRLSDKLMKFLLPMLVTLLLPAASCTRPDDPGQTVECRIAVVLPMDDGLGDHWKRTLKLCADNLEAASKGLDYGVKVEFEWYDELDSYLSRTMSRIAEREDITAVIGGLYSSDAKLMADILSCYDKPFFTMATTEQLVRAYSSWGNLWAMTETDITQCEVLLSKAIQYGAESVGLIADANSLYGQTFTDWFAFQARELGLSTKGVWSSGSDISGNASKAFASGADYIICAPSEISEVGEILTAYKAYDGPSRPKLLFSDIAYGTDVITTLGELCEGIEGVCFGSDPESGFDISYEAYFGEHTTTGEAQVYDACMLTAYAGLLTGTNPGMSFCEAMQRLVDGRGRNVGGWMSEDMHMTIRQLLDGQWPDIHGASGSLDFDSKVYTNVLSTVYCNYMIYQQEYVALDYNTSDGGRRSDATLAGWNWKASQMQELGTGQDIVCPDLDERWALLVATSEGWQNYRHQVDVLNIYQRLRMNGYDDSHIVLVMEDDLADNEHNPEPGILRSRIGGDNMYRDVKLDYHTSDLSPEDLCDILCGRSSDRLKEVIGADSDDNILIFWSGHGRSGALEWLDTADGFTASDAEAMLSAVEEGGNYRKLLWLVETCFSGSVAHVAENHPRMLSITAANAEETSKTDIFSMDLGVWMSNRFTSSLQDCADESTDITLSELYYRLFQNTVGSHVCIFGASGFGNLHQQKLDEWLGSR